MLERLAVEGLIDVFQTVKNLRIQRPAMVQTLVSMAELRVCLSVHSCLNGDVHMLIIYVCVSCSFKQ